MKNTKAEINDTALEEVIGGTQTDIRKDFYENIILSSDNRNCFIGLIPEEERLPINSSDN